MNTNSCCTPLSRHACGAVGSSSASWKPVVPRTGAAQTSCVSAPAQPARLLPGGTFLMGTDYAEAFAADREGPIRPVTLSPFAVDIYPVRNAEFAEFIGATGYRTDAERFGWSFCFWMQLDPGRLDELVEDTVAAAPWWCKVPGAAWGHPEGPGSDVTTRADHPVVHVSWHDAAAYAAWAGKILPTEAQWEYAARGGLVQKLYPWGDELTPTDSRTGQPQHRCNIWQGEFPRVDTADDGFRGTCPVDTFPCNEYGIFSMTGNTWEWCADWFATDFADPRSFDPRGPASGQRKAMRGGSFLCHASYCNRYRVAARTANTPESSASNVGFRCVSSM